MSKRRFDITGTRSGLLTAVSLSHSKGGRTWWHCRCDCGNDKVVMAQAILAGTTVTCGSAEHRRARMEGKGGTHHKSKTLTYSIWCGMRKRCSNPKAHAYDRYGGRGIKVCDRWSDFAAFLADMGECPPSHEIERNDVNGHYEPSNCRWATPAEQSLNKRNNRVVMLNGSLVTVKEYADAMGLRYATAYARMVIRGGAPTREDFLTRSHQRVMASNPELIWETEE